MSDLGLGRRAMKRGNSFIRMCKHMSFPCVLVKNLPTMQETQVRFLGWEDPLEKEMAIHSSILAWRIPWTVACQAPLFMGSQKLDMT